jgi:hypothetical protein
MGQDPSLVVTPFLVQTGLSDANIPTNGAPDDLRDRQVMARCAVSDGIIQRHWYSDRHHGRTSFLVGSSRHW